MNHFRFFTLLLLFLFGINAPLCVWASEPIIDLSQISATRRGDPTQYPEVEPDSRFMVDQSVVGVVNLYHGLVDVRIPLLHVPLNGGVALDVTLTNIKRRQYMPLKDGGIIGWVLMHLLGDNFNITPGITVYKLYDGQADLPLFLDPQGRTHLFYPHSGNTYYSTDGWKADLHRDTDNDHLAGSYFRGIVYSPTGVKYQIAHGFNGTTDYWGGLSPLTRIEDVTGKNWVSYHFGSGDQEHLLAAMRTSEGLEIQFDSFGIWQRRRWYPHMAAMHDSTGRHWDFLYMTDMSNRIRLTGVHLPDGRQWTIRYPDVFQARPASIDDVTEIDYPNGAYQRFAYHDRDRRYVDHDQDMVVSETDYRIGSMTTSFYDYPAEHERMNPLDVVVRTDQTRHTYRFDNPYTRRDALWNDGLLLSEVVADGAGLVLEEINNTWTPRVISNLSGGAQALLKARIIHRDGGTYITKNLAFDSQGYATETQEQGNRTRVVKRRYEHNTDHWTHPLRTETIEDTSGEVFSHLEQTVNALGQVIRRVSDGIEQQYTYDDAGNLAVKTDALGNQVAYGDYHAGVPGVVQGYQQDDRYTVDALGRMVSRENHLTGARWRYRYDLANRLVGVEAPLSEPVEIQWDTPNLGDQKVIQGDHITSLVYSLVGMGLQATVTQRDKALGLSVTSHQIYGHFGRLVEEYMPLADGVMRHRGYRYDALGRVEARGYYEGDQLAGHEEITFGAYRRSQVDVLGHRTDLAYDYFADPDTGYLRELVAPVGAKIDYAHDVVGRLLRMTRGGVTRRWERDPLTHRVVAVDDPERSVVQYAYDLAGQLIEARVGELVRTYRYDPAGHRVVLQASDGSDAIHFGYELGRLVSAERGGSRWDYRYDMLDRVVQADFTLDGRSYGFGYTYDALGALQSMRYPDGFEVSYHPDALSRPTQVSGVLSGITYVGMHRLAGYETGDGNQVTYRYEPILGRMSHFRVHHGGVVLGLDYTYDLLNLLQVTDVVGGQRSRALSYDAVGHLVADKRVSGAFRYSYDDLDNLVERAGPDGVDRIVIDDRQLAVGLEGRHPMVMAYDQMGNMVRRGDKTFRFNAWGQLVGVGGLSGSDAVYRYDAFGERIEKRVGGTRELSIYRGGRLLYRVMPGGGVRDEIYLGSRLVASRSSGGFEYYYGDVLGSVVAQSRSEAGGAIDWFRDYGAYGDFVGEGVDVGLAGMVFDRESGLYDDHARYYDPVLGRFISMDPADAVVGRVWSFNRYIYGNDSPFRYIDPDGANPVLAVVYGVVSTGLVGYDTYRHFRAGGWLAAGKAFAIDGAIAAATGAAGRLVSKGIAAIKGLSKARRLSRNGAHSAKQAANLREHFRQLQEYGASGTKTLQNGRVRYYGTFKPARYEGEMSGRRLVREWDPETNAKRTWHETLDHEGVIRQVRPEFNNGVKKHYMFNTVGTYMGKWP